MIGDNLVTDIHAAKERGFTTLWARYGTIIDEKNKRTMVELTPSSVLRTWATIGMAEPDYTLDRISQVLDVVPAMTQGSLF